MGLVASVIGNTVGQFIPWPCNACGGTHMISQYSGNIVDGSVQCPQTGQWVAQ